MIRRLQLGKPEHSLAFVRDNLLLGILLNGIVPLLRIGGYTS